MNNFETESDTKILALSCKFLIFKTYYLYLYLSPLRKRNSLTSPSGNRGNLNIFLKNTPKKPSNLNSNSISNPNLDLNFKYPATFQVNKKVNKKVNMSRRGHVKILKRLSLSAEF